MKFTQKLNLIVEGIGSSRNLYLNLPSFDTKDDKFLNIIDRIFIVKKLINYINEEIEEFNKKSKYKKQIFYVKLNIPEDFYELFKENLSHREGIFNLDKLKKSFIDKILELYKDKIEKIDDIENNINLDYFQYTIFTIDGKYVSNSSFRESASRPFDINNIIHELVLHFIVNEKDIYNFNSEIEGYGFINPYKFSPESILNEFFAMQDGFKKYHIDTYLELLYLKYEDQFKNKLTPENFFKNLKVNKVLLNHLIKFLTLGTKYPIHEKYNFSFKDMQDIKIFLEKNYKKHFEQVIKGIEDIIETKKINKKTPYSFIQNVANSIKYIKEKSKKINPDEIEATWKDFRLFFRNYPNLLRLFPEDKYPDHVDLFIDNDMYDEKSDDESIFSAFRVNYKIVNALHTGQSLMKKAIPKKSDFENPEAKIDFILEKISNLIRNNLTDNSKYYKILEDKLKNK